MSLTSKLTDWLPTGVKEYAQAEALRTVVDPETTPFDSKYKAIEIYKKLIQDLDTLKSTSGEGGAATATVPERLYLLLFGLYFESALTHLESEDLHSAERCLVQCIDVVRKGLKLCFIVEDFNSNDEATSVFADPEDAKPIPCSLSLLLINLYNQLGFLKSMKLHFRGAVPFPKEAEKIYYVWEKTDPKISPLTIKDLFNFPADALTLESLEKLLTPAVTPETSEMSKAHTMTTYYLAQAYQQTGEYDDSARYCHQTLRSQHRFLEAGVPVVGVDHIEWALNAATLSQYFAANENFDAARHLICCARKVWLSTPDSVKESEDERWKKAGADLDRIEVKYCLQIIDDSYQLIQSDQLKNIPVVEYQFKPFLLNDPSLIEAEQKLPGFPVRSVSEARLAVKYGQSAIESAKKFFTINERASDYVDCVFDHSSLFGSIVPFDPSIDIRSRYLKRRIDMLEALIGELNPQYFLQHCRKIHYELGDIYSQQISLKYAAHEEQFAKQQAMLAGGGPAADQILSQEEIDKNVKVFKKINELVTKSIGHYHRFLSSFECLNKKEKNPAARMNEPIMKIPLDRLEWFEMPKRIASHQGETEGYLQAIVTAYLAIGRLHTKQVTSEPKERVLNWVQCEKYYKMLKDYLTRNEDQKRQHFEAYWSKLEEMLELIPGKIQYILSQSVPF